MCIECNTDNFNNIIEEKIMVDELTEIIAEITGYSVIFVNKKILLLDMRDEGWSRHLDRVNYVKMVIQEIEK
ncbi:hypothetical protein GCM10007916_00360 [Psychromonas marina]|uniref:Uncharacterized protein n=1 Tax=Psychromonas marina TaxID=88364 RepID=A0ABQ6DV30_9GAMM|nr:hypothetical protein GCM10007916_00360 [Psychromonas marina]